MMTSASLTPAKGRGSVLYRTTETTGTTEGQIATFKTLTLNGIEIELRDEQETHFSEVSTLYKKADRADLDKKDRLALIAAATEKKESTYFTALALALDDESKLDDCYNIGTKVEKVEARHRLYDMHDVFTIVVPEADGKTLKEEAYNLYTEYATVTPDMVAASNKWYNSWPKGPTWQENLNWTHQFFEYNVATEVAEKVNELYMLYPIESRGGPLYFILLMNQLLSQTEEAVLALQVRLKKLNLKNIPGENVDKAISLARAAILRLETFNKTPEDLVRNLLKSFQTTSVASFNEVFRHMEKQRFLDQALGGGRDKLTASGIFNVAAAQYRLLWEEGEWTGVRTQGEAIFTNRTGGNTRGVCWNCGRSPNHQLPKCTLPRDQSKIDKMKEAYRKEKKAKQGDKDDGKKTDSNRPPGKWRPPTAEENNRRSINGKPMFWSGQRKKWVPDRGTKSANSAATTTAAPTTPSPAPSVAPIAPTPVVPTNHTAAISAARQAYANAFAALQQLG
jgi:hypothetical protein